MKRIIKKLIVILTICVTVLCAAACGSLYSKTGETDTQGGNYTYYTDDDTDDADNVNNADNTDEANHKTSALNQNNADKSDNQKASKQQDTLPAGEPESITKEESTKAVISREEKLAQIPHYRTRYYISQLDGELLDNFGVLYEATKKHKESCTFISKVNKEELDAMLFALKYDCPELFCLDNVRTYYAEGDEERNIVKVNIDYIMDEETYEKKLEEALRTIEQIISLCSGNPYEKRLAVYDYLTGNCNYNKGTANCGNAYGALVEKQTKCDGISLAYMWILEEMGEECFVIAGTAEGDVEGHGWNAVKADGEYYAFDLTSDLSNVYLSGKRDTWYPAFNVSLDWVYNRYPISEMPPFFSTASGYDMSISYHVLNGTFCGAGDDVYQMIYDAIDRAANDQDDTSLLQFELDTDYDFFVNEYGNIVSTWAEESGCQSVEYTYGSLQDYRTVQLRVTAEYMEENDSDG